MELFSEEEVQAYTRFVEATKHYQEMIARREMAEDLAHAEGVLPQKSPKSMEERMRDAAVGIEDPYSLPFEDGEQYCERVSKPHLARRAMERDIREKIGLPDEWRPKEEKIAFYKRQLALLDRANAAPRCEHVYADGTRCGCPKMRKGRWCYAHGRMKQVKPKKLNLLVMEDANCVVLNIAILQKALLEGTITAKEAGLLFYSTQTAASVLPRVTFKETNPEDVVVEAAEEEEEQEVEEAALIEGDAISDDELEDVAEEDNGCGEEEGEELAAEDGEVEALPDGSVSAPGGDDGSGRSAENIAGDESDKSCVFGDERDGGHRVIGSDRAQSALSVEEGFVAQAAIPEEGSGRRLA